MASFDGNGLVIDRLADIRTQMRTDLRGVFGSGINLDERAPFGVIVGIMSERYSLIYELLEALYLASFPNTSFGVYLHELVALNGITPNGETFSTVDLTFTRSNLIGDPDVDIGLGTQVGASGSSVIWSTITATVIPSGSMSVTVRARANTAGAIGALAGTVTSLITTPTNVASVTNSADATLGSAAETDAALKRRRVTQLGRFGTATDPGIRSALQELDSIQNSTNVLNDTDSPIGLLPPHSVQAYIALNSGFTLGQIGELVFDAALVTSNSIAIQINGVAITGSPVVFNTVNATTLVDIASAIEAEDGIASATSDGVDTIAILSSNGETYTLTAVVTGGASQAVGTYSILVAVTETIDQVAQTIWDSKSAGIQTYGEYSGTALDSVGDPRTVRFSVLEAVRVYVEVTLTTDGTYEPTTGEAAILESIAEYALAALFRGVDVLNYKILCAASDADVEGITDISIEMSVDNVVFNANNLTIESFQFATISTSDIDFV